MLVTSIVFWFLGMIKGWWFSGDQSILILDTISFVIAVMILFALNRGIRPDVLANLYCLSWLPMFILYWKYYNGIEGSMTYVFFTVLVIFLGLLQGRARMFMTIGFSLINLMLTLDAEAEILLTIAPSENLINPLSLNYLVNSIMVAAIVVFIKVQFDNERKNIEIQNQYLDRINDELSLKNEMLSNQQLQIKAIQNNLEELVHERTVELENRNKELEAYAYDNAHVVRRPLSNILSLLEILNQENLEGASKSQIMEIKKKASDLDEVVQKINMILN